MLMGSVSALCEARLLLMGCGGNLYGLVVTSKQEKEVQTMCSNPLTQSRASHQPGHTLASGPARFHYKVVGVDFDCVALRSMCLYTLSTSLKGALMS